MGFPLRMMKISGNSVVGVFLFTYNNETYLQAKMISTPQNYILSRWDVSFYVHVDFTIIKTKI